MKYISSLKNNTALLKNISYLGVVQGLNYILPLITLPYLVRVIGVEKFGVISLATAVISFFLVITDYGFNYTATREVALNKNNNKELVNIFSSVMIVKFLLLFLSFIFLIFLIFFVSKFKEYSIIYYLTFGSVIGQVLFPIWFFQGMEKMKFVAIVNISSKILSTILIFLLVKSAGDYYLVPMLISFGAISSGLFSIYLIWKEFGIHFKFQRKSELLRHIKGGKNLFLTSFLSTLLTSSGLLILGFFANHSVVGVYASIEKLFKAITGVFSPITQAIYPLSCRKVNQNKTLAREYIYRLVAAMIAVSLMVIFVVIFNANNILNIFYGSDLTQYSYILKIMMLWLFFGVVNNVVGIQFLSAKKLDVFYLKSFIFAGLITLLLNFFLIPKLVMDGILYSMVIGELVLTFSMLFLIRKNRLF